MTYTIDVKHPSYIMMSSDFSQQEPKLTAFVSKEPSLIKAFKEGKDVYATIASLAFNKPYEECLEFHPVTGEHQPHGKKRRNEAKTILLGITYGRSVMSIGQQLYGGDPTISDEDKTKQAQRVYDSVMNAFPELRRFMIQSQNFASKYGYVETILGRRRHISDMTLKDFEFKPLPGYVNPNIDPLDLSTLEGESGIPEEHIEKLTEEFNGYKYFGQIAKRTRELYDNEHIKVINNRMKKQDATRKCVNCVDFETEILTTRGWKKYNEVNVGDKIYSYSLDHNIIVEDEIKQLHIVEEKTQAYHIHNASFDTICTKDHRWVMRNFDTNQVRVFATEHILRFHKPRYHILRIANNDLNDNLSQLYLDINDTDVFEEFKDRLFGNYITYDELNELDFKSASNLYKYFKDNVAVKGTVKFDNEEVADKFQMLCFLAGQAANKNSRSIEKKRKNTVETTYSVSVPKRVMYQTARIDLMKKEEVEVDGVWCVTTNESTWIARRNGRYYITGNSIIQGSAADFTKMALINVATDPKWELVGGKILTLVHDEIIAQAPVDTYEAAATILKQNMEKAGSFLPFDIHCDVEVTYRWYGLEAPCKYSKPDSLDTMNEEGIKWVQYHLVESEFELPVIEDNGDAIGDAAHGISGIMTEDMANAIDTYCSRYNILKDNFIEHIDEKVRLGK